MKAAAESGWDFSYRWCIRTNKDAKLSLVNASTIEIIPVDLNAILHWNARLLIRFHKILGNFEVSLSLNHPSLNHPSAPIAPQTVCAHPWKMLLLPHDIKEKYGNITLEIRGYNTNLNIILVSSLLRSYKWASIMREETKVDHG